MSASVGSAPPSSDLQQLLDGAAPSAPTTILRPTLTPSLTHTVMKFHTLCAAAGFAAAGGVMGPPPPPGMVPPPNRAMVPPGAPPGPQSRIDPSQIPRPGAAPGELALLPHRSQ
eukprot:scaffold121388_cov22-Tisochrysis_lutea.AAC.2